jgi:hypothetical protein
MIDDTLKQVTQFFGTYREERTVKLERKIGACLVDLNKKNLFNSDATGGNLATIYSEEFSWRINSSWQLTKKYFDRHNLLFESSELDSIASQIKECSLSEANHLKTHATLSTFFPLMNRSFDPLKQIKDLMATTTNGLTSKIIGELNFYKILQNNGNTLKKESNKKRDEYVDMARIKELQDISNPKFDLSRLIKLCQELNIAHENECSLSISMILRTILNHVPPIFNCKNFDEVANNYSGSKKKSAFKKLMKNLNITLKNIADIHLHQQIQRKEALPSFNQINFIQTIDILLSEIITILG